MNIPICTISCYGEDRLKQGAKGFVHSVYQKTINLSLDQGFVALQAAHSPLSPISLICSIDPIKMQSLQIAREDLAECKEECLLIKSDAQSYFFSYADAEKINLSISDALSLDSCRLLAENMKKALSSDQTGGFSMFLFQDHKEELSLMHDAAKKRIQKCLRFYREGSCPAAAKELSGLIGLGIGLTPSGDDFLCGVLAGLKLSGMESSVFALHLKKRIADCLADTIEISAAFLSCALEGQFGLAVNNLLNLPSAEQMRSDFLAIGHSSGMDTLCGVLFALNLLF